jgi:hypothetical protein
MPDVGQVTPIEIVGLSLKGGSLSIPDGIYAGTYNLFAGLQKYYGNLTATSFPLNPPYPNPSANITGLGPKSEGQMFISDKMGTKTWDSLFTLKAMAFGVPVGSTLDTTTEDFVRTTLQGMVTPLSNDGPYDCKSNVFGISYDLLCVSVYNIVDNKFKIFRAFDEPWKTAPGPFDIIGENLVPLLDPSKPPTEYYPSEFCLDRVV